MAQLGLEPTPVRLKTASLNAFFSCFTHPPGPMLSQLPSAAQPGYHAMEMPPARVEDQQDLQEMGRNNESTSPGAGQQQGAGG